MSTDFLFYCFRLLDESPQRLIAAGKRKQAEKILKRIAKYNKEEYAKDSLKSEEEKALLTAKANMLSLADVWRTYIREPVILGYLAICMFAW